MNILEIIIIALASALEIVSIVLCKGAVLSKISKDKISKLVVIFIFCQLITLLLGNFLADFVLHRNITELQSWFLNGVVILVFILLSLEMIIKSFQNDFLQEIRNDIMEWRDAWKISYLTGITGFMTGFGLGILKTNILTQISVFAISTAVAVVAGLFVGYRFGYHPKKKAYFFAGTLLFAIDIELFYRFFLQ